MIHIIAKNVRYTEWKLLQRNLDKQSFFAKANVACRQQLKKITCRSRMLTMLNLMCFGCFAPGQLVHGCFS